MPKIFDLFCLLERLTLIIKMEYKCPKSLAYFAIWEIDFDHKNGRYMPKIFGLFFLLGRLNLIIKMEDKCPKSLAYFTCSGD